MATPYVELHAHSAFSFLDGASTPLELAAAAAELGYPAFALTDHDGIWGSMEFAHACKGFGVRPIVGAELTIAVEELVHVTLLVEDPTGYRNLCRLLTAAHSHTREDASRSAGQPWVTLEQMEEHAAGLVCLSGCAGEGALAGALARDDPATAAALGRRLLAAFGRDRFRVELQRPYWRGDRARNRRLAALAERLGVPRVATGNVHSHTRRRALLQDAFVAVRLGTTLEASEPRRRGNRSSALASPQAMAERFAEHPGAVAETLRLAERLRFDLTAELGYRYPGSEEEGTDRVLAEVCRARLDERYAGSRHRADAERRLEQELGTIRQLGLAGFFLLHRELLELAREVALEVRGPESARNVLPPGRGRGSSVSSIVCYLTGLSHIDPVKADLFAGRFLNDEVEAVPDIDLDFPRDIREKLIPRVHDRYGAERSALVAAFPTYRPRGVVRDLGKALALAPAEIERVAKTVGFHERGAEIARDVIAAIGAERAAAPGWRALLWLADEAMGLPRHASQHPGGMVISTRPLVDVCPVVPAAMEGRQIVQWDKDSCSDAGFLKIDLLGLGMLSAVERCVEEVGRTRGERLDLSRIPLDDEKTFRSIRTAETTGVFQIESRAQMQMLPRTRPENLDDLTVQVALVRPGPIQGGAVHPYIERRKRLRGDPEFEIPYEHCLLEPVLRDTLGTIVYQEQVIEVAMALAGFTSSEAEGLRRAMSRKRSEQAIEEHHDRFLVGAVGEKEVPFETAERVWRQIQGFSGFGFPKAHSAAFGLLAYQSAWLRVHRPPEFLCALLNEQPMGFYPPDALVHEAQRRGVRLAGPDINRSQVLCHVETPRRRAENTTPAPVLGPSVGEGVVRIGLGYVKGVCQEEMDDLVAARERDGAYRDLADIASRSGAGHPTLERLAWAGALNPLIGDVPGVRHHCGRSITGTSSGGGRREALWEVGIAATGVRREGGTQMALPLETPGAPALEPLGEWGEMIADYRSIGMTLGEHPMAMLRDGLAPELLCSADLERAKDEATVEVAGMVVARQRPETARGIVFMLLEDERGTVNLIVPPAVYDRRRAEVRAAPLVCARGTLERREGTTNVVVSEVRELERTAPPSGAARTPPQGPEPSLTAAAFAKAKRIARECEARRRAVAQLRAVTPAGHSFGRRGH
ncbi:MAG TPA: error-prone DNA polymerase [Solirubrobacterales bacterium]|jgi:error-prone DNA polymerase|nr:error-prone DNA polymerase [Solirubrobacterales bacterium]